MLGDELSSVTNTEDGDSEFVYLWIELRCAFDVDALGASRQDDCHRCPFLDFGGADPVRDYFRIDLRLPHSAGDELGVLGTKVND